MRLRYRVDNPPRALIDNLNFGMRSVIGDNAAWPANASLFCRINATQGLFRPAHNRIGDIHMNNRYAARL